MEVGPSSRIGPYALLDRLGAGGMGEVYRARDVRLDRVVALKVLRVDRVSDPRSRQRLLHEARALSALNNPHVAALFDVITYEECDCLVMEYVPGAPLHQLLAAGPLPVPTALRYAIQVADALAAAHERNIIHRDLKPSNIAVTPDGSVKLLDFGIARHVHSACPTQVTPSFTVTADAPGALAGTPPYMSPEQVTGRELDERTDIFSFGAVFYEMITGRRAFEGETTLATAAAILHKEPVPARQVVPETPPELETVIARCLQKDPTRRFRRIGDVKQILELIETRSQRETPAAGVPQRRIGVGAIVVACVVVAALVAAFATSVWTRTARPGEQALRTEPLTTYPGLELSPACSPDGASVAFQWDGPQQTNWDIYVKVLAAGDPVRLTTNDAEDLSPAWSPDGRYIAFLRVEDDRALVVTVPAVGGGQERIAGIIPAPRSYHWRLDGRLLAWTPDGNWIAVPWPDRESGKTRISLLGAQTGEMRELTPAPMSRGARDRNPAFSWDGRFLAFARSSTSYSAVLFLLPLTDGYRPAGPPRQLTSGAGLNDAPAWSPDGREILFHSNRSGESGIWTMDVSGLTPPRRLVGAGDNGHSPAVSRQGRLVYVNARVQDTNIWRLPLKTPGAAPTRLVYSSRTDSSPQLTGDGRQIAFQSDRNGPLEIWAANADGSRAFPITRFGRGHTGTPRWSPDGRTVVFDSNVSGQFQVYTVALEGGEPRQLTKVRTMAAIPSWSHDSRWIYYTGQETGRDEIWKISADGGQAIRVTSNGGSVPFESWDGSSLFYLRGGAIWSMPRDGGEERRIVDKVRNRNYAVAHRSIYFEREVEPTGSAICFYSFATGKESEIYRTLLPTHNGLAVSRDETFLLFTEVDHEGSDLMVADLRH